MCFKQRILKGKHGQTKPRLKTQERRGEQTRGFCACARPARPATRRQLPEQEEEGEEQEEEEEEEEEEEGEVLPERRQAANM